MAVDILLRRHTLLCIFIHTHPLYSVQNKHVTIDRRYADTKRISNNKKTASKKKANHRQIDDRHNEWKRKKKKLSSELTFYIVSDDDGRWSPRLSSVVIAKHAIDDSMRSPPKEEGRRRSREEKKKQKENIPIYQTRFSSILKPLTPSLCGFSVIHYSTTRNIFLHIFFLLSFLRHALPSFC